MGDYLLTIGKTGIFNTILDVGHFLKKIVPFASRINCPDLHQP